MTILDRRGVVLSATDPPISTDPNPTLAYKAPVRVATTGSNITLSGLLTIDGVTLAAGDRVLVKDQTDQTTNGLYNANATTWSRAIDASNNSQFATGMQVYVTAGTINANTVFAMTNTAAVVLGNTLITFASIGSVGGAASSNTRTVNSAGSLTITNTDRIVKINAAVTSITLPPASSKVGNVTIIDILGTFTASPATVTISGGGNIAGLSTDTIDADFATRTYQPITDNGNYGKE
jgi:phage-related tail fiber protein